MDFRPSVLIIAPNSFDFFTGTTAENQFHLLTRDGRAASLLRLDLMLDPARVETRLRERGRENPMAGYYLESFLKQRNYAARVVFDFDRDDLIEAGLQSDPMAVLLSTTFITDRNLLFRSIARLRGLIGDKPLIIGGPFIWKQKQELDHLRARDDSRAYLERMRSFDADPLADNLFGTLPPPDMRGNIFIGHEFGEYTLLSVLETLARPRSDESDLLEIPNLILPAEDAWVMTEHAPEPVNLDQDFTRWDLVDEMPRVVPLRASVGCPYRCRFCDFIELHPLVMMRSPASILAEIELAMARDRTVFDFIDDNIFLSKQRIKHLTETLIQAGKGIHWGGFFRADRVDEDNARDLWRSGCRYGLCGIESGDDDMLRRMRKGGRVADQRRGLELALEHGIYTALTFLVGFPGETAGSILRTAEFASSLPGDGRAFAFYQAYPFYILPNTSVDRPEFRSRYNLRGRFAAWSHDTMDAETAVHEASRELFQNADLPYNYHGNDAPGWWSVDRRNRAFAARKKLTEVFLTGGSDRDVQFRFSELAGVFSEDRGGGPIPPWRHVLADRSAQPGRRLPVERVGAFAPA